jgi:hypothetical protein
VDSRCQLGILLKAFFKKEPLLQALINKYTKENYFVRAGQDKNSFDLNVAACRMILDIIPGWSLRLPKFLQKLKEFMTINIL